MALMVKILSPESIVMEPRFRLVKRCWVVMSGKDPTIKEISVLLRVKERSSLMLLEEVIKE